MNNLQSQIQNLVAQAKIEEALELFGQWAEKNNAELYNNVILLKGRFNTSKRNENLGLVSFSDASRDRAIIANSVLELTKQIGDSDVKTDSKKNVSTSVSTSNKILFLASNPVNTDKLDLDAEFARLYTSLRESDNFPFDIRPTWSVTPQELQSGMLEQRPRIVHFSGHGTGGGEAGDRAIGEASTPEQEAGIYLQDANGKGQLVSGFALANLFKICLKRFPIDAVLLNACHSKSQAEAISLAGVPYVIGMNRAVKDSTAIVFSTGFYRGLASENDIEFAFDLAVNAIMLEGLSGEDIPVLYKEGKVVNR
jgi:Effector-associated domain 11/CHAT domain